MSNDDTSRTDESSNEAQRRGGRRRRPLESAAIKHRLMRDLALSGKTMTELGEKYGVTHSAVSQFHTRHILQIQEMRRDSENELAGILYVAKGERLQKYAELLESGEVSADTAAKLMRNIAEELGALPNRLNVQAEQTVKVEHVVKGVDLDSLR